MQKAVRDALTAFTDATAGKRRQNRQRGTEGRQSTSNGQRTGVYRRKCPVHRFIRLRPSFLGGKAPSEQVKFSSNLKPCNPQFARVCALC